METEVNSEGVREFTPQVAWQHWVLVEQSLTDSLVCMYVLFKLPALPSVVLLLGHSNGCAVMVQIALHCNSPECTATDRPVLPLTTLYCPPAHLHISCR